MVLFKRGSTIVGDDPLHFQEKLDECLFKVNYYSNTCLIYFLGELSTARNSFLYWQKKLPKSDFDKHIEYITILGDIGLSLLKIVRPRIGKGVTPIWIILKNIVKEQATNQSRRDDFADSLGNYLNNVRVAVNESLLNKVILQIKTKDPALWTEIQRRYYFREPWAPLLHQAGLPNNEVKYHHKFLTTLIFEYQKWVFEHENGPRFKNLVFTIDPNYYESLRRQSRLFANETTRIKLPL